MAKATIKQHLNKFLWDIPPVVIAVLLALGLNSWKQNRAEEAVATESLKAILKEIKTNTISITSFKNENQLILDELISLRDSMEINGLESANQLRLNFSFKILSSATWETSQTKEIAKYNSPEVIRSIAKLYNTQKLLDDFWEKQLNKITAVSFYKEESDLANIEAHIVLLRLAVNIADVYLTSQENIVKEYSKLME